MLCNCASDLSGGGSGTVLIVIMTFSGVEDGDASTCNGGGMIAHIVVGCGLLIGGARAPDTVIGDGVLVCVDLWFMRT